MKRQVHQYLRPALTGLAILAAMCLHPASQAQDLIVNDWTNATSFNLDWSNFRSYATNVTYAFDPTQNSAGDTNAGSMYVTVQWPSKSNPTWNENWNDIQLAFGTPPFNPTNYISFDVAIKVDVAHSSPAVDGTSYGALELIVNNPWTSVVGWQTLAVTNGWQHFSGSFSSIASETNSEAVIGFISDGNDSLTSTVSYWIGDIVFTAPPTVNTNRPNLSLAKAPPPGLTCIANEPDGTYQRQMISSAGSNYSWNTSTSISNTTTYSMTIASFPAPNYGGFNAQMFLIPASGLVSGPSVDWYSANAAAVMIGVNPDGTATGGFQYKINNPGNWNTALVVPQSCATGPLGKWSLTFNQNTNVTLTAPNNTFTNFTIPAADAAYFQDPLFVYVGIQPNNNANLGQSATFSRVRVSGSAGSINDSFTSLNPTTWVEYAEDPAGVFITSADARYWVTWPLPDSGYTNLFATDNLTKKLDASQWLSLPTAATGWINVGGAQRLAIINQSSLDTAFRYTPTNCFFGLLHP
jgi:hypothetical protein